MTTPMNNRVLYVPGYDGTMISLKARFDDCDFSRVGFMKTLMMENKYNKWINMDIIL